MKIDTNILNKAKFDNRFMIKARNKAGIEGRHFNIAKAYRANPQLTSYSVVKSLKAFPLRSETTQKMSTLTTSI